MTIDTDKYIFDKFEISDIFYPDYCDRKTIYEFMLDKKEWVRGKVLDFGCGRKPYQSLFDVEQYIGIDTTQSGHDFRDKGGPDVWYDGTEIPFEDESFDTVLTTQVFEHVEKMNEVMSEIARIHKIGGVLVVTVPMAEEEHEIPYDFRRFTEIGLVAYLGKYGYESLESGKLNSWRNSMRILNIAHLCKDTGRGMVSKIMRWGYIVHCNLHRMIFGNRVNHTLLFSNKVYCIARKTQKGKPGIKC